MTASDRTMRRWAAIVAAIVTAAIVAAPARIAAAAPVSAVDRAAAEALFREGRALMKEERYEEACAKFEESMRREPAGGTLLNLAICHERRGLLATAWVELHQALSMAHRDGRADRQRIAEEHIAAIEPRLSRLTLVVDETARLDGLELVIDGAELGEAAWNTALPLDPGEHVVTATAPGHRSWRETIVVDEEGASLELRVPPLEPRPSERSPKPPPKAPKAASPEPLAEHPADARADEPRAPDGASLEASRPSERTGLELWTAGWVVTGAGAAALLAGSVAGVVAFAKHGQSNAECPNERCSERGVRLEEEAQTAATAANAGFGIGLGLTAVGAVLLLIDAAPDPPTGLDARMAAGPEGGALWLVGRF